MPAVVGDEEAQGEWIEVNEDDVAEDQDTENLRKAPNPILPSAEEVDDHRCAGHHPYRCWCRECVEGRATGEHRPKTDGRHKTIPTVAFDYFFLTAGGVQRREELTEYPDDDEGSRKLVEARHAGLIVKVLLMKCSATKVVLGHVVPCKGVDEEPHVVKLVACDVAWLGHSRVLLKSDNEPSLVKLVVAALRESRIECSDNLEQIAKEHPEPYD